jgi:hypothetical protein
MTRLPESSDPFAFRRARTALRRVIPTGNSLKAVNAMHQQSECHSQRSFQLHLEEIERFHLNENLLGLVTQSLALASQE